MALERHTSNIMCLHCPFFQFANASVISNTCCLFCNSMGIEKLKFCEANWPHNAWLRYKDTVLYSQHFSRTLSGFTELWYS